MRLITESGYADEAFLCRDCTSIASILLPDSSTGRTSDSESEGCRFEPYSGIHFGDCMIKTVIIKIEPGYDPYDVLEQIRPIGFELDRVSQITDEFVLIIGQLEIDKILQLRHFDGVQSFQTDGGIKKL